MYSRFAALSILFVFGLGLSCTAAIAQETETEPDDSSELIELIVGFLSEEDNEMRALAYEQIISEAEGEAATKVFAAQLPKLKPEAQAGLLNALARRGDRSARAAVQELISNSKATNVRVAAINALGKLGEPNDVQSLIDLLKDDADEIQKAATQSLVQLQGDSVSDLIANRLSERSTQKTLLDILVTRRAHDVLPKITPLAVSSDPAARGAAMQALGKLAGESEIPAMIDGVLKAKQGAERESAEKCIMFVCQRIEDSKQRALPVLTALEKLPADQQMELLSTLGRIGGDEALTKIEAALADPKTHSAGLRALCNWPSAEIAPRLIELIHSDKHPGHATTVLRALIRVAPLPDDRSNAERLELLQRAMAMCTRDTERNLVLDRCRAVRTIESLRYVLPYVDGPAYTKQACKSVVELAHDRELRDNNKAEFHRALDRVMATTKDTVLLDRAQRYKEGKTWVRPGK